MIADLAVAVGLWKEKRWAEHLFILVALSQLVAYGGLLDSPQNQLFLIAFHLLTVGLYFILQKHQSKPLQKLI